MILEGNVVDSVSDGASLSSSQMKLSATAHAHIINMAIKNYRDKIGSIVRELTSNAVDSHRMAGIVEPVRVRLLKNITGAFEFRVEDKGVGLDEEEFYKFIGSVGESNKQQRNDLIGAFGIGAKSPLSLVDTYYFICRKDGKERKFIISQGNPTAKLEKVYEKDTIDGNGVIVIVPISHSNTYDFTKKMKEQLAYFPDVYFENQYSTIDNVFTIYRGEDFQYSQLCQDTYLHLTLDDVYYSISWKDLGIAQIYIPIALRFSLSDGLVPLPNREEITYTTEAKEIIMNKLKKVATWFCMKFNTDNKENDSFKKVYNDINNNIHTVYLSGQNFTIDQFAAYSAIPLDGIKVRGCVLKPPAWYKGHSHIFLGEYEIVGELNHSAVWKKKWYSDLFNNFIRNNSKIVELNPGQHVGGKWKQYLREKYGRSVLFVKRNKERYLKNSTVSPQIIHDNLCLVSNLELHTYPKEEWRPRIKEFLELESTLTKEFIDETASYIPDQWLIDNTAKNKTKYIAKGKLLNKQDGDMTISYARNSFFGKDKPIFERKAYKIKGLGKNPYLSVILSEQQKETIEGYWKAFIKQKVKFCTIGVREANKLPKIHNFITMEEFEKSKPFARVATSILINRLLAKVPENRRGYLTDAFPKWIDLFDRLKKYSKKDEYIADEEVENIILEQAVKGSIYDFEIYYDYKELRKIVETFYFLSMVKEDGYYDTEDDKKARNNLIYTFMLVKKIHGDDVGNYELVKIEPKTEEEAVDSNSLGECEILVDNDLVTI